MAQIVHDEKLLIHFFQYSLSDAALKWYMRLNNTEIWGWKDLVGAFMKQYKYNMDIDPCISNLLIMEMGNKETIWEYTQRWLEKIALVEPLLLEKEETNLFFNTFKTPFFTI